jgi:hypothetical protein
MLKIGFLLTFALALASCTDDIKSIRFSGLKNSMSVIKDKVSQYDAIDRTIEESIMEQMEVVQQWILEGNPDLGLPVLDPFQAEHFEYGTSTDDITFNIAFDGIHLTGLAQFVLSEIDVNLLQLRVEGTIQIPEIRGWADHYYLDGLIAGILPLFGEGGIDLTVHNISLSGAASLTTLNNQIGLKDVVVGATFDSITGNIENILGGDMDDVINDILNILGADIFDSVAALISADVAETITQAVNAQLEGMSLQDLIDIIEGGGEEPTVAPTDPPATEAPAVVVVKQGNANEYMDAVLENVRAYLVSNGYDNYTLPDQLEGFSEEWIGIEWHGEAELTQGFMSGLQTIHRSGDAFLSVNGDDGTITLESTIEFFDLNAGYSMYVGFMGIGLDAKADVEISSLQIFLRARLVVTSGKAFEVFIDELNIAQPGLVTVHFDGLGPLDIIVDALGFIVGNVFGGLILNAVEGPIQDAIISALGEVLPFAYLL